MDWMVWQVVQVAFILLKWDLEAVPSTPPFHHYHHHAQNAISSKVSFDLFTFDRAGGWEE